MVNGGEGRKTTLAVGIDTHQRIERIKRVGESFDDTLNRILDQYERLSDGQQPLSPEPEDEGRRVVRELTFNDQTQERIDALNAVFEYLIDHEEVKKREFIDEIYKEHHVSYSSPQSWWETFIKPGLEECQFAKKPKRNNPWRLLADNYDEAVSINH